MIKKAIWNARRRPNGTVANISYKDMDRFVKAAQEVAGANEQRIAKALKFIDEEAEWSKPLDHVATLLRGEED